MVEILPFLGNGEFNVLSQQIDAQGRSWREDTNLQAAPTLVPYYLSNEYEEKYRWTTYPGLGKVEVANTHFVGVAGIGLDAARYKEGDPGVAKKLGVFRYDTPTKIDQITDGLGNTIVALQVPPTYKRPWMAGGGATVMGVPETGSVKPFVTEVTIGDAKKRGTIAIMGDGKVRFISETISDDDFKAMCTIAGGETVDLNRVAPEVPSGKSELNTKPIPTAPVRPINESNKPD
jgi:hypothetical protein